MYQMIINQQKQELRKYIKLKKEELTFEQKLQLSDKIFAQVENSPSFKKANTILAYWAMKDEVQTQSFILRWQSKKRFVLPVVKGDVLELREFTGTDGLTSSNSFDLLEPKSGKIVAPAELDLVIVPGVAFDKKGNRLGRGKAYYDKLLCNLIVYKLAVCFALQFVEHIPVDETDIQMDEVIWV